jgi:hypothetical protein
LIQYLGYVLLPVAAFSCGTLLVVARGPGVKGGADNQAELAAPAPLVVQDQPIKLSATEPLTPAPVARLQDEPLIVQTPTSSVAQPLPQPLVEQAASSDLVAALKEEPSASRQQEAQALLSQYLAAWSSHNADALGSTPRFYGSRVRFYGKDISAQALTEEKKRFVQHWPVRHYRARPGTTSSRCDSATNTCKVIALMEYRVENPARGRQAKGTAGLELEIGFASGAPRIVEEGGGTSRAPSRAKGTAVTAPGAEAAEGMVPLPPSRPESRS